MGRRNDGQDWSIIDNWLLRDGGRAGRARNARMHSMAGRARSPGRARMAVIADTAGSGGRV